MSRGTALGPSHGVHAAKGDSSVPAASGPAQAHPCLSTCLHQDSGPRSCRQRRGGVNVTGGQPQLLRHDNQRVNARAFCCWGTVLRHMGHRRPPGEHTLYSLSFLPRLAPLLPRYCFLRSLAKSATHTQVRVLGFAFKGT